MNQVQIKSDISTETLEFKFELKLFDDCEEVEENSTFSKYLTKNTPQTLSPNDHTVSTSTLWPVYG
jgi:hypothetical protein